MPKPEPIVINWELSGWELEYKILSKKKHKIHEQYIARVTWKLQGVIVDIKTIYAIFHNREDAQEWIYKEIKDA